MEAKFDLKTTLFQIFQKINEMKNSMGEKPLFISQAEFLEESEKDMLELISAAAEVLKFEMKHNLETSKDKKDILSQALAESTSKIPELQDEVKQLKDKLLLREKECDNLGRLIQEKEHRIKELIKEIEEKQKEELDDADTDTDNDDDEEEGDYASKWQGQDNL